MPGPEATIERQLCREAKAAGWKVYKLVFVNVRGAPDRWFGKDGSSVLIEFKDLGEEATPQQLRRHRELREYFGIETHVCDTLDGARRVLGIRRNWHAEKNTIRRGRDEKDRGHTRVRGRPL